MTPNALAGSMGLNGMSVILATRRRLPEIAVVETHPKVLYWAICRRKHDYAGAQPAMEEALRHACGAAFTTANEHEWDAAISGYAAASGLCNCWTTDLHALPPTPGERLITPCGTTNYYWPEC
jgi:hypothetical protein